MSLWGPDRDRDADDAAQADRAEQVGFRHVGGGGGGSSSSTGCLVVLVYLLAVTAVALAVAW